MDVSLKKCQRRSSLGSESIQGSDLSKEHKRANRLRREQIKREAKGKEKTVRRTKPVDYKAMPRIRSPTLLRPVRSTTNEMDFISHILRGPQNITQPDYTTDTSKSFQSPRSYNQPEFTFLTGVENDPTSGAFGTTRVYLDSGCTRGLKSNLDLNCSTVTINGDTNIKTSEAVYIKTTQPDFLIGCCTRALSGATNFKESESDYGIIIPNNAANIITSESNGAYITSQSNLDLNCSSLTINGATHIKTSESGCCTRALSGATNFKESESDYGIIIPNNAANIITSELDCSNITLNGAKISKSGSRNSVFDWSTLNFHYRAKDDLTSESRFLCFDASDINRNPDQERALDFPSVEETKEDYELHVMRDINFLPRYKYHRSLLDWFIGGLPEDPAFIECCFMDCSIIVGGNFSDEKQKQLFNEAPLLEKMTPLNLQTDSTALADVLVVYFYSGDVAQMLREITKLRNYHMFGKGTILVVTTTDYIDDMILKFTIVEKMKTLQITSVEFVDEIRSEIIKKITCILEPRLTEYLTQIKIKLLEHSSLTSNVRQSLLEVNAILRKLKRAACYLEPLAEDEDGEKTVDREIDEILQRFRDNILYQGYDGDKLYVITNDQSIKENLEAWFLESGIESLQLVITLEETLSTTELSKRGEPLNGAKFVYEHNSVGDFKEDMCYATIGCLMLTDDDTMVAVTCQHALEKKESFFTLINNAVVKLGKEKPQVNKQMARLYEDIALIVIDSETRNDIKNYCERLLIDSCGEPSPAEIASESLKKGDIVHKWGATTGLTTGIVKEVKHQAIGRFTSACTVTFITGRDSEPFAKEGDSGALIFKHSESLEQNIIYIYGMVQSRLKVPFANAPIICSQFKESFDSLKNNLPDIQTLDFPEV